MLLLKNQNTPLPEDSKCDLYIAPMGEKAALKATELCARLREDGFEAQTDICGRGLKAQMKYADKIGALYSVVIGDNELETDACVLKCMATGETTEVKISDISDELLKVKTHAALENLQNSVF